MSSKRLQKQAQFGSNLAPNETITHLKISPKSAPKGLI